MKQQKPLLAQKTWTKRTKVETSQYLNNINQQKQKNSILMVQKDRPETK
jgi:hypothetical protein